jgi:hypothetical protein
MDVPYTKKTAKDFTQPSFFVSYFKVVAILSWIKFGFVEAESPTIPP